MLCHNKVTAGQAYPGLSPQDELKSKPEHLGRYSHIIHALGNLTDTTQNPEMTRSQPEAQLLLAHAGASGCRTGVGEQSRGLLMFTYVYTHGRGQMVPAIAWKMRKGHCGECGADLFEKFVYALFGHHVEVEKVACQEAGSLPTPSDPALPVGHRAGASAGR